MKRLSLMLFLTLLTACATPGALPTPVNIDKSRSYNAPYDKVWAAIIAGVAEANLNITTLEKDSGIVAISNTIYDPSWANEGGRGSVLGVPDQVMERLATFNIFATRQGTGETRVQVNSSFKMNIRRGNGSQVIPFTYQWQTSYSNGTLEQIILDGVARRIQQ